MYVSSIPALFAEHRQYCIYVWPSSEAVREKVHKKKFSSYLEMRVRLLEAGELETRRKEHDKCTAYNNAV